MATARPATGSRFRISPPLGQLGRVAREQTINCAPWAEIRCFAPQIRLSRSEEVTVALSWSDVCKGATAQARVTAQIQNNKSQDKIQKSLRIQRVSCQFLQHVQHTIKYLHTRTFISRVPTRSRSIESRFDGVRLVHGNFMQLV